MEGYPLHPYLSKHMQYQHIRYKATVAENILSRINCFFSFNLYVGTASDPYTSPIAPMTPTSPADPGPVELSCAKQQKVRERWKRGWLSSKRNPVHPFLLALIDESFLLAILPPIEVVTIPPLQFVLIALDE